MQENLGLAVTGAGVPWQVMAAKPEPGPSTDLGEIGRADSRRNAIAATLAMGLLTGTFTWWALKFGAYFGTVMYPGVALLGVGMAVMLGAAPWRASLALSGRTRLALFSLVALVFWSALSALWSPTPDIAIEDARYPFRNGWAKLAVVHFVGPTARLIIRPEIERRAP